MEPKWQDGLRGPDRLRDYGYWSDADNRQALYSTVKLSENNLGFSINATENGVNLLRFGEIIGQVDLEKLERKLIQKLKRTVYVGADTDIRNGREHFHYNRVTYCENPTIGKYV